MATALNPRYELMEMTHETSNTVRNDLKLVMESMEEWTQNLSSSSRTDVLFGNGLESEAEQFDEMDDFFSSRRELVEVNASE